MSSISKQELDMHGHYVVVRTAQGNEIVRSNPRTIPRRLRVLLLAIDGVQPVTLYTQSLKGFGDISDLLIELMDLGLIGLMEPEAARQQRLSGKSNSYMALDSLLDDSQFNSQNAVDVLYGSTEPGSFDDLIRAAKAEKEAEKAQQPTISVIIEPSLDDFSTTHQPPKLSADALEVAAQTNSASARPAPTPTTTPARSAAAATLPPKRVPALAAAPAPAPIPVAVQREQIESLFNMLEAVRGERKNLREQLAKLQRVKEAAILLNKKNKRLQTTVYALSALCLILATSLAIVLMK